jgi:signal transduction histidine kinase
MPNHLDGLAVASSFETRVRRVFWLLLGGLIVVAASGAVAAAAVAGTSRDIETAQTAARLASRVREGLLEQANGLRGYILTGRDDTRERYVSGGAAADENHDQLWETAATIGGLPPLLTELDDAIETWRSVADDEVALVRAGRATEVGAIVRSGVPQDRFDVIRQRSDDLDEFLERIVDARRARQNALGRWLMAGTAVVVTAGALVIVSTRRWLVRSVSAPLAALADAAAHGDPRPFETLGAGDVSGEISALARNTGRFLSAKDLERHEAVLDAADDERRRIAADLHDGPVQTMFALQLMLRRLGGRLRGRGDPDGAEVTDEAVAALESTQAQLRWMMFDLAPPGLGDRPFADLLGEMMSQVLEPPTRLRTDIPRDVDADTTVQYVLYRVITEALRNVNKHAAASEVSITVTSSERALGVEITDDGVGFEPSRAAPGHAGLDIMRSMVASVGGVIDISSAPARGTAIHVVVPAGFRAGGRMPA